MRKSVAHRSIDEGNCIITGVPFLKPGEENNLSLKGTVISEASFHLEAHKISPMKLRRPQIRHQTTDNRRLCIAGHNSGLKSSDVSHHLLLRVCMVISNSCSFIVNVDNFLEGIRYVKYRKGRARQLILTSQQ